MVLCINDCRIEIGEEDGLKGGAVTETEQYIGKFSRPRSRCHVGLVYFCKEIEINNNYISIIIVCS